MKAQQQLASVLLALFICVRGQQYVPYGPGLNGIQTGQVPAANIIRAPPLPNAPVSSSPVVNLNLPIGRSYKAPEGAYGIGSVVQNGRISIPPGATVAANGNGRLTDVLGLGSLYVERGVSGGSPGRLVRIQKRSADESRDVRHHYEEDLRTAVRELTGAGVLPRHTKHVEYDRESMYRLAKEAIKKNPRKGISFKKPEGGYGVGSIFDSVNPPFSKDTENHKKLEAKVSRKYPVREDAPNSPEEALRTLADHPKGVSYKKPEGEYGVASLFDTTTLFNPFFHRRHRRQAVGSGSVTAVLVDFDKDTDSPAQPPSAPTSSFAPVVGFTVQEPEGGTPSKHILKNVIYRKRPGSFKPAFSPDAPPTKHVLRIPDSIELPPLGGIPEKTGEESPDIQIVASQGTARSKPVVSRKATSTATIEFRPTFPVEHIKPALPPLPRPSTRHHSKASHSHTDASALKKAPAKSMTESHKLATSPLVAVPPGQVVYNRQLAASVPVQPVRNVGLQSRPPAVPTQTLRPVPTVQRVFSQPQLQATAQPTAQVQPQLQAQHNVVAAAPAAAPQSTLQVQPPVVAAAPPQLQAVAASPYPGALYQQYTPLDPTTYQVAQPGQYQTFHHSPYALPYAAIVADPYNQARIVRSTAGRLRQQASPFESSSTYYLTKRIIQGVHS
ncbi:hypothetical protein HPB49_011053 [Dermacentor silvarum]|uniref:Uncharacterized protein n=1 Tax=Dermacentor silvarum TaxID=543639 RepID=A0ACB8C8T8_DERSI|nr:uncharacterized protein LOC119460639 [Dermacentor silvarum]KAH7937351.1 hypothetical protein HPB49_011053 [Dermacentor silvarum]